MNVYEFGKANFESVKKVAQHFAQVGATTPTTADELGLSGAFMASLVRRNALAIIGRKEKFVCIDEHRQLYQRYEVNVYILNMHPKAFWDAYVRCVEDECNVKRRDAEGYISTAKSKLTEVENLLAKVGTIRI